TSHTYTAHVDTGLQPSATVPGLTLGQTYYFAVTAVDSTGKESPFSNEVSVTVGAAVMPPVANFSTNPTSGTAPLAVAFTDTSTGPPAAWAGTSGNGPSSPPQSPTHPYTTAGTYTVQLTATNAGGGTTATGTITVSAPLPPPVASFTANPTNGTAPVTV